MGEFYRGWKRKVGVLSLGLACLFAAGWVRSLSIIDLIDLRWTSDYSASESFVSVSGCLGWSQHFVQPNRLDHQSESKASSGLMMMFPEWRAYTRDGVMTELPKDSYINTPFANWCWKLGGVGIGTVDGVLASGEFCREKCWATPYWSIVVPLTILSFWFLLSKPHQSTPKKTALPNQDEGGAAS